MTSPVKFGKTYHRNFWDWLQSLLTFGRIYRVYKRYHEYNGRYHDTLVTETLSKKSAREIVDNINTAGRSEDHRINYEGVIK
jgi:hypothetical protein